MDKEVFEGAAGPSNPGGAAGSGESGREMDPEDEVMEEKFFEILTGMINMNIQEKGACEYKSLPSAKRCLEINPPIPIGEDFSLDPSDGEVILGTGEDTSTHEADFTEALSEDEFNFIDELFIEYVWKNEKSIPQCSIPASTDVKADEIVSTGSSAKETSGENVTSAPHIINDNAKKGGAGATSDNENKPTTSFDPSQSTSDIRTEDEENIGKIFDDNHPLMALPQYFDKIVEIGGKRFVQKSRLRCFMKNYIVQTEEEGKESGKQKHTKDSVSSPLKEQGTASKNKKKRRKAKKKTDGDRKQDSTESISNSKDASANCSNLGLTKDSEGSSMPDFECDAKNKVVEETSESKDNSDSKGDEKGAIEGDGKNKVVEEISEHKDIPDSKGDEKDAIESDATKVEETLESKDIPDSKCDEKGAIEGDGKNKVVKEISEPKDIPGSKDYEKDAIKSDAKKVEETLKTQDISDSKDYEKSAIEGDAKNKVVEETSGSKDIPDLKDNEKGAEEEPSMLKQENTAGNISQNSKSRKKHKKKDIKKNTL